LRGMKLLRRSLAYVTSGIIPIVGVQCSLCELDKIVVLEMSHLKPAPERLFAAG
jgi:hypothetical protein